MSQPPTYDACVMKNKRVILQANRTAAPIPTRPQDEPFWISIAGTLCFAGLLYLTWTVS